MMTVVNPETEVFANAGAEWKQVGCPLCGASRCRPIFLDPVTWNGKRYVFRHVKCLECGLLYNSPVNTTGVGKEYDYVNLSEAAPEELLRRLSGYLRGLEHLEKVFGKAEGKRLLDIGCGCGAFLDLARVHGYSCFGIEAADVQARFARETLGLKVETSLNIPSHIPPEFFDVVTMWEVLEHLVEPGPMLDSVWRALKPGGTLFLTIPNGPFQIFKSQVLRIFQLRREDFLGVGEHLVHYSSRTIAAMLQGHQFVPLLVEPSRNVLGPRTKQFRTLKVLYQYVIDGTYRVLGTQIGRGLTVLARKEQVSQK